MQFRVDQRFAAPADAVLAMYLDQEFYGSLAGMEKIGPPEVLSLPRDDEAGRAHLRLRYAFVGDLPRAALAVLDPRKLTWVEDTEVDLTERNARVQFKPDNYADRLTASAAWRIEADGDEASTRRVDGSVEVRMPFVGGQVEKAIISGLREHLVAEQDRAADWLRRHR
jgi:hypothetical protein